MSTNPLSMTRKESLMLDIGVSFLIGAVGLVFVSFFLGMSGIISVQIADMILFSAVGVFIVGALCGMGAVLKS